MSPYPPNDTSVGRAYNHLRTLARREGRSTEELITLYALERFLFRISTSDLADRFVLKGGLLLALFEARRTTRDIDLLARAISNDEKTVLAHVTKIAAMPLDDGIDFEHSALRTSPIREDDFYGGVRVIIPAHLGRARARLQLDISFGDPVTPAPQRIRYPELVDGGSFPLLGYPIETVLAEKVITCLERSSSNTRDRDYADVWRLTGRHHLSAAPLRHALDATATHRGLVLGPLSAVIGDLAASRQLPYSAWRAKQGVDGAGYPKDFTAVVQGVTDFADPLLDAASPVSRWDRSSRTWS
ncbi:nucleotidyl transferase AbiEii/AbiGii toxin family protein [Microtetraspora malaysiensis]|uniref:nucleotidyl transferase AbiEii/AbiGii toxin family protein n=1 Tax=Microtetraspora malaysiensis TaxID=161358 RepID=UPI00082DD5B7|nr:nucleotidyl transferase AbiEii/AbiGii toxin family protein [Microtetraspora malaysiensis]